MYKIFLSLFLIIFIIGCSTTPINVDIPASPEQDEKDSSYKEKRLGEAGYYFIVLNYKLDDDMKVINRLNRIGARIAAYTERPEIRYKYIVIDSKYRNAFSLANGYLILTNSLLEHLKKDEELAGIIAHEIAHVTHKHVLELYEHKIGKSLTAIVGEKVLRVSTDLHLKQAYELQSDQTALRYLYRAGFNVESYISLLKKIKTIEEEDYALFKKEAEEDPKLKRSVEKYLVKDHPLTSNRIVNIQNVISETLADEKVQYDPEDFTF